jgi:H+/Cl- antiporter ClcA
MVTLLAGFMMVASRLFGRLKVPAIARSTLGGVVSGIVGVALPLTMFSGSDQLHCVLSHAGTLGLGLLVATLIAKMLTSAVSQESGFVGGPIFPSLFIGGTAGSSSTRSSPACHWDWRSPACSPPSPGRPRPSPWC